MHVPWSKNVTVDLVKGGHQVLETFVHADGRLFDVQIDSRHL